MPSSTSEFRGKKELDRAQSALEKMLSKVQQYQLPLDIVAYIAGHSSQDYSMVRYVSTIQKGFSATSLCVRVVIATYKR